MLTGWAALVVVAPLAVAQEPAGSVPDAVPAPLPMPELAVTPPASGQARVEPMPAPGVSGGGTMIENGTPLGCRGCGLVHGLGHGCLTVHELGRSYLAGRRLVRFWGGCTHPLPPLGGPAGYWDHPAPLAGSVPSAVPSENRAKTSDGSTGR
ncbi:MAG: hypothetical protein KatS3mg108_2228 [Isosphaeraceae bacterium]|nr:MAG: hypothetical protein KatS3mg108_2228 [Isosphaeraceae bacterium]